jgi:hypothetical protein
MDLSGILVAVVAGISTVRLGEQSSNLRGLSLCMSTKFGTLAEPGTNVEHALPDQLER